MNLSLLPCPAPKGPSVIRRDPRRKQMQHSGRSVFVSRGHAINVGLVAKSAMEDSLLVKLANRSIGFAAIMSSQRKEVRCFHCGLYGQYLVYAASQLSLTFLRHSTKLYPHPGIDLGLAAADFPRKRRETGAASTKFWRFCSPNYLMQGCSGRRYSA